jgi:glycine/D-amino acid oxidase-like deaminating enzyme
MYTAEVVIIGGGIIGASIAYHLRQEGETGRVIVIERDATYARASTAMSLGGIRQLYGVPCNIAMGRYSLQVYEQFDAVMAGDWGRSHAHFHQRGYCFIMTPENRDELLRKFDIQRQMGVEVECLTPAQLQERIPALRVDDLSGAIYGQRDGYLNPRGALQGYVERSRELGCIWLQDEVTGFTPRRIGGG